MITTLSVREEVFDKLKKEKKVQIQCKSNFDMNEKIYVSNRGVTTNPIFAEIIGKGKIKSPLHGKMFLYTIKCK
ncbi:MAG: hypothetical protein AB1333_04090 [Patescibacteria group bacterium]